MSFSAQAAISSAQSSMDASLPATKSEANDKLTVLRQDSRENISEMNFGLYSAMSDFGAKGLGVGEAVRFTAPKPGWKLKALQISGWSVFNNTTKRFPADRNFLLEVRDKDANLLYKFADAQNMYFASTTGPVIYKMDIVPVAVTGDFYVIFYDRGSMLLGMEQGNGTGNSYLVVDGRVLPAEFTARNNETMKVNWLIRAIGE